MKPLTLCSKITLCITLLLSQLSFAESNTLNKKADSLRIATFNVGLDKAKKRGELYQMLIDGEYVPARKSAEILQRVRPDIVLINEIDGHDNGKTLELYRKSYLQKSWNNQKAIKYPYIYQPSCNTGVDAGINFRTGENEREAGKNDNYGFGHYEGQYCMAVLSRYPLDIENIKSFQNFLWKDFPNALLPELNGNPFYSEKGIEHFRLSSKNHADVPVLVNGKTLNLLISHPTPPVFDGEEDRNGRRNHDEVKFWQYYINGQTNWLYEDKHKSPVTGLSHQQRFVILGDLNASVVDGDAAEIDGLRAIESLLNSPKIMPGLSEKSDAPNIPKSLGGKENNSENKYGAFNTAGWRMRADYVIPSSFGFKQINQGVFWPSKTDSLRYLVDDEDKGHSSSDHRLVWVDLQFVE